MKYMNGSYLGSAGEPEDGATSLLSGIRYPDRFMRSLIMPPLILMSREELECKLKDSMEDENVNLIQQYFTLIYINTSFKKITIIIL